MLMSAVDGKALPSLRGLNSPLPPVTAPLPAWPSRSGGNPSSSRRIVRRDRLHSLPQSPQELLPWLPSSPNSGGVRDNQDGVEADERTTAGIDPIQRMFQLERNLRFLKEQHHLVLNSLQMEVEELKTQNKALQFQLVVGSDLVARTDQLSLKDDPEPVTETLRSDGHHDKTIGKIDKAVMTDAKSDPENSAGLNSAAKMEMMQVENQELHAALHDARNRNMYLVSLIEQIKRRHATEIQTKRQKPPDALPMQGTAALICEFPAVYAHKFEEYEETIQQLRRENVELQTDLNRLKATLREVLSSNKWTPEAYMMARSVLQEGANARGHFHRLPRIPVRPPHEPPRRLSSLPAISQHGFNSMQAQRGQHSLPTVPQSKPHGSGPNSGRHENRYNKHPNSQKRQQRNHVP